MTIANGYCTLAEFKAFGLPDAATDAADDAVIENIIEAASRYIDGRTSRVYYKSAQAEVRYFTADSQAAAEIDDLVSVTALETDNSLNRSYGWSWAATEYDLAPFNAAAKGMPYTFIQVTPLAAAAFPVAPKGIKITGVFGFPAVPDDINQACLIIAKSIYQRRQGDNMSGQTVITAGGVLITPQDIPAEAIHMIQRYVKIV